MLDGALQRGRRDLLLASPASQPIHPFVQTVSRRRRAVAASCKRAARQKNASNSQTETEGAHQATGGTKFGFVFVNLPRVSLGRRTSPARGATICVAAVAAAALCEQG